MQTARPSVQTTAVGRRGEGSPSRNPAPGLRSDASIRSRGDRIPVAPLGNPRAHRLLPRLPRASAEGSQVLPGGPQLRGVCGATLQAPASASGVPAGRGYGGLSRAAPLPAPRRPAEYSAPRGNRAAVAGAFVRAEQAPKGSAGFPAPALTTAGPLPPSPATPSRPALRRLPELTFWMAAGVISPLPRCLGAANATDMLPPSPRSASPERSGGRGAGGPTPASRAGPPRRAPRGGGRGSGAARIAGRARPGAEPQLPARRLGS